MKPTEAAMQWGDLNAVYSRKYKRIEKWDWAPDGTDLSEVEHCKPLPAHLPSLFKLKATTRGDWPDYMDNGLNWPICSRRFKEIVGPLVVGDCEFLPLPLLDESGQKPENDYWVMNVLRSVSCLDCARSRVTVEPETDFSTGGIMVVYNMTLVSERIPKDARVFRLPEYPIRVLTRGDVIRAMRAGHLKGIRIDPVNLSATGGPTARQQ